MFQASLLFYFNAVGARLDCDVAPCRLGFESLASHMPMYLNKDQASPTLEVGETFDEDDDLMFRVPCGLHGYDHAYLDRDAVSQLVEHLQEVLSVPRLEHS